MFFAKTRRLMFTSFNDRRVLPVIHRFGLFGETAVLIPFKCY